MRAQAEEACQTVSAWLKDRIFGAMTVAPARAVEAEVPPEPQLEQEWQREPQVAFPEQMEQPDINELVAARLAEAERTGFIESRDRAPQEPTPEEQMLNELGVLPFRRAPLPSYGQKSGRIERVGTQTMAVD